mgnify:CR=1 FL=1
MLNYKTISIIFLIAISTLAVCSCIVEIKFYYFIAAVLLYLAFIFYGSCYILSGFFMSAYCFKDTETREISISFDDGPVPAVSLRVLDILQEYDVKAAFFCIGHKILNNESIVKRMDEEGHLIGNHSYSHSFWYDFYSSKKMSADMQRTEEIIFNAIGKKPKCFRPPYGVINPAVKKAAHRLNYNVMGWSIRSLDTAIKNESRILDRVIKKIKPGAVILFHDTNPRILNVLRGLLSYTKSNGYKITRLDKLFEIEAYS